jgi:phage head maturation protease
LTAGDDLVTVPQRNPESVLGRRSMNTARFWEESDGLHYEADIPDTLFARDLKTLIDRGDVRESDVLFSITQSHWEQGASGRVRIVEKGVLISCGPGVLSLFPGATVKVVE